MSRWMERLMIGMALVAWLGCGSSDEGSSGGDTAEETGETGEETGETGEETGEETGVTTVPGSGGLTIAATPPEEEGCSTRSSAPVAPWLVLLVLLALARRTPQVQ